MCGITGFVDYKGNSSPEILKAMTDSLVHRGPDDEGYLYETSGSYQLALGHRRLSIIDLSPLGHQPMNIDGLSIVFNGEIYNYAEIKSELEKEGIFFTTASDTEVILKSYRKWGAACLEKFIGMFAFVIYDRNRQHLFCVRDRAGVKPFYYLFKDGYFAFASELKAFAKNPNIELAVDKDAIQSFLSYGSVITPMSVYKNVLKLEPGHSLTLHLASKTIENNCYWSVFDAYQQPALKMDEKDVLLHTEELLRSACNYRMVADVPVGVFLSGGYDSSIVTALIQSDRSLPVKTFTIGFNEDKFNEAKFAKKVAEHLGTDHTEYYCSEREALDIIPQLPQWYDEPFGDSSAIPTILVSRLARKKVTVALSADAGDEVFGGYTRFFYAKKLHDYFHLLQSFGAAGLFSGICKAIPSDKIPFTDNIAHFDNKYLKLLEMSGKKHPAECLDIMEKFLMPSELKKYTHLVSKSNNLSSVFSFQKIINGDALNNLFAFDYRMYLMDDILVKVDRATMSVSLEGREPLLDHRLVEFLARIPSEIKVRNNHPKYILKKIVHKYIPEEIMNRPKMGFSVPLTKWLRTDLRELLNDYLSEDALKKSNIFNYKNIAAIKSSFLNGRNSHLYQLWNILMYQMWAGYWKKNIS